MTQSFALVVSGLFAADEFTVGLRAPDRGGRWDTGAQMHLGAPRGALVRAAFDAQVERFHPHDPAADCAAGYGARLLVHAAGGRVLACYSHLADTAAGLVEGAWIARGAVLGRVAGFGGVTPHVRLALAEMVAGAPRGVDNLYWLFQHLDEWDRVNVTFAQDGSAPTASRPPPVFRVPYAYPKPRGQARLAP